MDVKLKRQIIVFALIFFNMLIVFDWIQMGFGPPQGVLAKLVSTVLATVIYGGLIYWLNKRKNRGKS